MNQNLPAPINHDLDDVLTALDTAAYTTEQFLIHQRQSLNELTFFSLVCLLTSARVCLVQLSLAATARHKDNRAWLDKALADLANNPFKQP